MILEFPYLQCFKLLFPKVKLCLSVARMLLRCFLLDSNGQNKFPKIQTAEAALERTFTPLSIAYKNTHWSSSDTNYFITFSPSA